MLRLKNLLIVLLIILAMKSQGQSIPSTFKNPIVPGFSPDPSICRVGDDYYLVNSSFVWFPAIPIFHSKDLVNWELIGHGVSRPGLLNFDGVKDKNGIWAVTIRHHNGVFYLITTCSDCKGNFYLTAKNPKGPWSDPVWIKDAPGIDASLFWDDDGKCYYLGNSWDFKKSWAGQCAIWMQEFDLKQQKLVGERKILTYGHAANAGFAEGPHLYKINKNYLLIAAEGGTDQYHAVTAHVSKSLFGPYQPTKINPVLSHRQLGKNAPIQAVGHADLVQTQNGDWWATVLAKRVVEGEVTLSRETFLTKVNFEDDTPVFNPDEGKVLPEQERPKLPWTPVKNDPARDEFEENSLAVKWHFVRIPKQKFYSLANGKLTLNLLPKVADSLECPAMIIQKIQHHQFSATTHCTFKASKEDEQAGLVVYRTNDNYYSLLKDKSTIILIKKYNGNKEIIAKMPYSKKEVLFRAVGDNLKVDFSFGETEANLKPIGGTQTLLVIAESSLNKFNGPGVGVYATSNGKKSSASAVFDWFDYHSN